MSTTRALFATDGLPPELLELLDTAEPWHILTELDQLMARVTGSIQGQVHATAVLEGEVFVAEGATVGPHAYICGPAFIATGANVGHAVYLRDGVYLAEGASVGHSSEVKRALLLPGARAPHFNYVGDSVIGREVNLGAGVKLANFNAFGNTINIDGQDSGLRKFGAAIGDHVSIGCNAVLAPGTVVGPRSVIYNGAMVRGRVPADTIVKFKPELEYTTKSAARK